MTSASPALTAQSTSRFVQTKRFRIHYHEAGQGHPIVLLHGSGPGATGWSNFRPNIEALSSGHRVLAVDMPGWGESDTQTAETGRDHVDALIDFLDEAGVDRAALVGNSMGGMTAISTAIHHPDRVSHLVTMGAPSPGPNLFSAGNGPSEGLKVLIEAYQEPTAENMKRLVRIMCFDPAMATDELAALRSAAATAHPEHLRSFLEGAQVTPDESPMAAFFGLTSRLAGIKAPTMAIHGRDDRVVHFENSLRLTTVVPDSRLVLLNRCGHWAQIEHAAEFNRLVASFVGTV
ncbi:alpha/beta fold hydrolase [Streptomyces bauhiniae]|uniref:Alpha/beta fold hydrolase n=1 Tax=Streptomyces bauhiniae TaxID=2340725 RepID=A0A7K3QYI1_9ACTN|nr:alpha/beta fold hydrolase [Streptomyces bauhiniae]